MPPAPLPSSEIARLATLAALDILDTPAEEVFDSFVRVARELVGAPISAVSLVAEERQWFKAITGLPGVAETPRDVSFCAHAILRPDEVLHVPDATRDPRFADNPLVTGAPGIRFYAGAPLVDGEGHALGALCVIDTIPREVAPEVLARLADVARGVSAALRLPGALRSLDAEARRDPLTGLGNRRALEARLAEPIPGTGLSLLLLDLDRFKEINDGLGHPAGDAALREVGRILRTARRADGAFRLGGDEFALVLPEALSERETLALGGRVHASLADTFCVDGTVVPLRASIGAATVAGRTSGTAASLVPLADRALYEAKRAGRGVTRVHRPERDGRGGAGPEPRAGVQRMDLEARLRRALVPGGAEPFSLVYQPIVDLRHARVSSLEALVRWSPEPGLSVSPGEFVPLAERTGLAPHLDRWVLRTAVAEAARHPGDWAVSVNVSAVTFTHADVPELVRAALEAAALPPSRLVVEMTETALAADGDRVRHAVEALRAAGVGVALDDFGCGHASLLALKRLPFSKVKIDRSLVSGLDADPVGQRAVAFVAEAGALLGMKVVAEGIETEAELREVHAAGVARGQGYFLSRPVPPSEIARVLSEATAQVASTLASIAPAAATLERSALVFPTAGISDYP